MIYRVFVSTSLIRRLTGLLINVLLLSVVSSRLAALSKAGDSNSLATSITSSGLLVWGQLLGNLL